MLVDWFVWLSGECSWNCWIASSAFSDAHEINASLVDVELSCVQLGSFSSPTSLLSAFWFSKLSMFLPIEFLVKASCGSFWNEDLGEVIFEFVDDVDISTSTDSVSVLRWFFNKLFKWSIVFDLDKKDVNTYDEFNVSMRMAVGNIFAWVVRVIELMCDKFKIRMFSCLSIFE